MASYRATREHIERHTLPLATSVDGVTFEFQASLHGLTLERGCYVMLEGDDGARLGQVTDISADTARMEMGGEVGGASSIVLRVARGSGLVLDQVGTPFHDALVRLAEPQEVAAVLARANPDRAGLDDRRAVPRARRPGRARQRWLQPAHVHVRAVGVWQDLLTGAAAGAGAGGDRAARHHPGPQLRLRGAGPGTGGRRPPGRGPLSAGTRPGGRLGKRRASRPPAAAPVRRAGHRGAGGHPGPGPGPRPGRVRRAGRPPAADAGRQAAHRARPARSTPTRRAPGTSACAPPTSAYSAGTSGPATNHRCSRSWRTRAPAAPWSTWVRSAGSRSSDWSPRPSSRSCGRCGRPGNPA